ncbi:flagellin [Clostridium botulinum]|uniref:flagellin n=1 Tax=Clostridium botulinum TaxID=1491 RepID=UPI00052C85C4|nr:flagellin [Clostridium botulinum]KGM96551.1 flagellin [Clostridium botulinum D str. CCUG 7971]KOC48483.1 flagellin [Clostridium botulinum]NFO98713.1 flagellin [Clostridium botulinum]OOV50620.1 flagellin [Clostridium botulinum D/C]OOV55462.1 flagellin [Clostridium botulinum D/C]
MLINNALVLGTFSKLNKNVKKTEKCNATASSGKRINKAADDAAGITICESFKAQVRGLSQGERNTQEGLSLLQCVDGHMEGIQKDLQRMREMAIENATDTRSDEDRKEAEKEFEQIKENIKYVSDNAEFNEIKLFDKDKKLSIQIKYEPFIYEEINLNELSLNSLGIESDNVLTRHTASKAMQSLDNAISKCVSQRVDIGSAMSRLESALNDGKNTNSSTTASLSRIEDIDMANAAMNLFKSDVLVKYTNAMVCHANQDTNNSMKLLR